VELSAGALAADELAGVAFGAWAELVA